jgi:hypothetical protein
MFVTACNIAPITCKLKFFLIILDIFVSFYLIYVLLYSEVIYLSIDGLIKLPEIWGTGYFLLFHQRFANL